MLGSIVRMARDLDSRLRLLRQQLYGKSSDNQIIRKSDDQMIRNSDTLTFRSDITYLYQDLFKITYLAVLAIGIQVILFILTKNRILNLNFF